MSTFYSYYMTKRPAGPGAQPSRGLIEVEDAEMDGVWSIIRYDRELTPKEIVDYELTPEFDFTYPLMRGKSPEEMFAILYDGSWYTITGAGGDIHEWMDGYQEALYKKGIGTIALWAVFKGKDMNRVFELTGHNRYPDDLTFLAFDLEGLDIEKLAAFKVEWGDRWFDDIVNNNAEREAEGNA